MNGSDKSVKQELRPCNQCELLRQTILLELPHQEWWCLWCIEVELMAALTAKVAQEENPALAIMTGWPKSYRELGKLQEETP